jgi:hypothetical protein
MKQVITLKTKFPPGDKKTLFDINQKGRYKTDLFDIHSTFTELKTDSQCEPLIIIE